MQNTDLPWLYGSGLEGAGRSVIGLEQQNEIALCLREDAPRIDGKLDEACCRFIRLGQPRETPPPERFFTVRLHFAESANVPAGQRLFAVRLQGKPVLRNFDIIAAADGMHRPVVKEFPGIAGSADIVLEMVPESPAGQTGAPPLVCAVELVEEER